MEKTGLFVKGGTSSNKGIQMIGRATNSIGSAWNPQQSFRHWSDSIHAFSRCREIPVMIYSNLSDNISRLNERIIVDMRDAKRKKKKEKSVTDLVMH